MPVLAISAMYLKLIDDYQTKECKLPASSCVELNSWGASAVGRIPDGLNGRHVRDLFRFDRDGYIYLFSPGNTRIS